jgi:hypothetical protein
MRAVPRSSTASASKVRVFREKISKYKSRIHVFLVNRNERRAALPVSLQTSPFLRTISGAIRLSPSECEQDIMSQVEKLFDRLLWKAIRGGSNFGGHTEATCGL